MFWGVFVLFCYHTNSVHYSWMIHYLRVFSISSKGVLSILFLFICFCFCKMQWLLLAQWLIAWRKPTSWWQSQLFIHGCNIDARDHAVPTQFRVGQNSKKIPYTQNPPDICDNLPWRNESQENPEFQGSWPKRHGCCAASKGNGIGIWARKEANWEHEGTRGSKMGVDYWFPQTELLGVTLWEGGEENIRGCGQRGKSSKLDRLELLKDIWNVRNVFPWKSE